MAELCPQAKQWLARELPWRLTLPPRRRPSGFADREALRIDSGRDYGDLAARIRRHPSRHPALRVWPNHLTSPPALCGSYVTIFRSRRRGPLLLNHQRKNRETLRKLQFCAFHPPEFCVTETNRG